MEKEKQDDFYQNMRKKVAGWAKTKAGKENPYLSVAMPAPDIFHLLVRLSLDKEVPVGSKAKLAGAIAYFISPIDVIPDFIPVVGYLDDVALAAYVLNEIINKNPELVKKHWAGEGDIIEIIGTILESVDAMIGKGLLKNILGLVGIKKRGSK